MMYEIVRSISGSPLRTLLTALGVMIGVASVIANLALGRGARQSVERSFRFLGSDAMQIAARFSLNDGDLKPTGKLLSYEDGLILPDLVDEIGRVDMSVSTGAKLRVGRVVKDARVSGTTQFALEQMAGGGQLQPAGWPADRALSADVMLARGRMFSRAEADESAPVCVIGHKHASDLFGGDDALGQTMLVGRVRCTVIGVLAELEFTNPDQRLNGEPNDSLLLPISTAIDELFDKPPSINITARVRDEARMVAARDAVAAVLRDRHAIETSEVIGSDGKPRTDFGDDFLITTRQDVLGAQLENARTFSLLLAALAGVSLAVGGIGIMNVMLVSVVERTREIGVRRAVGAKRGHIVIQFLSEAILISSIGGVLGVALGILMIPAAAALNKGVAVLDPASLPVSLGVAMTTGLVFGFYPAMRAAMLSPINALRHE